MIINEDRWAYLKWRRQEVDRKRRELSDEIWQVGEEEYSLRRGHATQEFDNRVIAYLMHKKAKEGK